MNHWSNRLLLMSSVGLILCAALALAAQCTPRPQPPGPGPADGSPADGSPADSSPGTTYLDASASPRPPQACRAVETIRGVSRIRRQVDIVPRIVGGSVAPAGRWPAAIALEQADGWQYCGATLIAPQWACTAAHCEVRPGELAVLGRLDLRTQTGEAIPVDWVLTHELYVSADQGHDVALLHLSRPSGQVPAPMVAAGAGLAGNAWAVGWGLTSEGAAATSPLLRQVEIPLVSYDACALAYPGLPGTVMCAGLAEDGKDTCQGDSGGGLFMGGQLVGITSFGEGCARPGRPGVYTAVGSVRAWIDACAPAEGGG